MKLKDRVSIVTGGGRGIGKAIALRFAEEGAKVVIGDTDEKTASQTSQEIMAKGFKNGQLFWR